MIQEEFAMENKKPTQAERLLYYLKNYGEINPLLAWSKLGIYRLSARINELKKSWNIVTETCVVENRFGEKCRVACYKLME